MFLGEQAAPNIAGGRETLQAAQNATAEGKPPDWTYKRLGWFRGEDDQWRTEIPDEDMKLTGELKKGEGPVALDQAIKHDELFKADPNLRNMTIEVDPSQGPGGAEHLNGHIKVHSANDKKAIVHEVAHGAQESQGFPEESSGTHTSDPNYWQNIGEREARDVEKRMDNPDAKPDLLKTAPRSMRGAG